MIKKYVASNEDFVSPYGTIYKLNNLTDSKIKYYLFPEISTPVNMTSNETDEWRVYASTVYADDAQPWIAFNKLYASSNGTHFHTASSQPHWLAWQNKIQKVLVKKIEITASYYNSAWSSSLSSVALQGSDDGSDWIDIKTLNGSYNTGNTNTFTLEDNETGYFHHRIYSLSPSSYMSVGNIIAYSKI